MFLLWDYFLLYFVIYKCYYKSDKLMHLLLKREKEFLSFFFLINDIPRLRLTCVFIMIIPYLNFKTYCAFFCLPLLFHNDGWSGANALIILKLVTSLRDNVRWVSRLLSFAVSVHSSFVMALTHTSKYCFCITKYHGLKI